jgi:hypothetical protein
MSKVIAEFFDHLNPFIPVFLAGEYDCGSLTDASDSAISHGHAKRMHVADTVLAITSKRKPTWHGTLMFPNLVLGDKFGSEEIRAK